MEVAALIDLVSVEIRDPQTADRQFPNSTISNKLTFFSWSGRFHSWTNATEIGFRSVDSSYGSHGRMTIQTGQKSIKPSINGQLLAISPAFPPQTIHCLPLLEFHKRHKTCSIISVGRSTVILVAPARLPH
jgi:hypothetical protein